MSTPAHPEELRLAAAMRLAQGGDQEAYRALLERIGILVEAYAARGLRRMGLEDARAAEDLAQEILIAVHKKRHTYDPTQWFTPWLFAIARYKLIDFARAKRREGLKVDVEGVQHALAAPEREEAGTAGDLQALLAQLPEKQRQALELVKLEGLSIAEASQITHSSESAVKVTIHRALKHLKDKVKKS